MITIGIDPGPEHFYLAVVGGDPLKLLRHSAVPLAEVGKTLRALQSQFGPDVQIAIEWLRARGMPTSNDELQLCYLIGAIGAEIRHSWRTIPRTDVKMHICGVVKATDSNIRQALIDMFGPAGTKKAPGPTYRVSGDTWQALAMAVTAAENAKTKNEPQFAAAACQV